MKEAILSWVKKKLMMEKSKIKNSKEMIDIKKIKIIDKIIFLKNFS